MKAVVFAYHNMGVTGLEALLRNGFTIQAVFSHNDDPGEKCWFASVAAWAKQRGIPVYCPEDVNTPEVVARIAALAPETIFSFYYRKMLSQQILAIPAAGAFNLHGSLLPAYRGRVPVNWVLVNGEKETGVTLHQMTARPDAGDMVGQRAVAIAFADTAVSLYEKLCAASAALLDEVLPLIRSGCAPRLPQDQNRASYFGGRKPEDGRIDWFWPALRIYNLIRAVTDPYPGAFTFLPGGEKLLIWWGTPEEMPAADRIEAIDVRSSTGDDDGSGGERLGDQVGIPVAGKPGLVVKDIGGAVYVVAGEGCLRLFDVEVADRRIRDGDIGNFFHDYGARRPVLG